MRERERPGELARAQPMNASFAAVLEADAPVGSRRRLVLVMALVTTLAELASGASLVPDLVLDGLSLPFSVLPALGLAAVCGDRLLGRSTARPAATAFWVAVIAVGASTALLFLRADRIGLWVAIVVASASEELVFRLAIPAALAAILRLAGMRVDRSRIVGLALAGMWFVFLPGHREQMQSLAGAIPFVAFAGLAAVVVYRSGSILPMAMAHTVSNLLTFLMWGEAVTPDARSMGLAFVLGLLLVAYGKPQRLTIDDRGGLVDTRTGLEVTAIDLRDGFPATVTLADGREFPIDDPPTLAEPTSPRPPSGSSC